MKNIIKLGIIIAIGVIISLLPTPEGLSRDSWLFFSLFLSVVIGLIIEPLPSAFIGLMGVVVACLLKIGPSPSPTADLTSEQVLKWGLSGFSNPTVWLIFAAFMFALGFDKSGLGRRIALILVKKMGYRTLGLGYAIAFADLLLAPFMPSNTARSGGTIFPIFRNIPLLYGSTPEENPRKIGSYITWVALASTCVTSSMFYTALAPNILAVSMLGDIGLLQPTWQQWAFYFLPVGIILILLVPFITYIVYPPTIKVSRDIPEWAKEEVAKMGPLSMNEIIMTLLGCLALFLWISGDIFDTNPTVSALVILCLMVLFKIITWNDILTNKSAWNVFMWFGALITLAGGLSNVGFLSWLAAKITSATSSFPPPVIMIILLVAFYVIHYFFASTTSHVGALFTLFILTAKSIPGINLTLLTYLLLFSVGLMGILTPYATGPSPIWYGFGYIPARTFWMLGALFGLIFLIILIIIGIPWINLWI
jgi:L-tartrate/succinate antiporter